MVKKKTELPQIAHHEAIELCQHVAKRNVAAQMRNRLGIDAVGDERGADAVAGNVANEKIQVIGIERADEPEVAANRTHRMIESFYFEAAHVSDFGARLCCTRAASVRSSSISLAALRR